MAEEEEEHSARTDETYGVNEQPKVPSSSDVVSSTLFVEIDAVVMLREG